MCGHEGAYILVYVILLNSDSGLVLDFLGFDLPPVYLKVHSASYHFLRNGKIRRFGCSLLFSGVASVTHVGYRRL